MPSISKNSRYILTGISAAVTVIATPILIVKTKKELISKKLSIGIGIVLLVVVAVLLGIAFGFSLTESSSKDNVDETVPCFYISAKRLPLKGKVSTVTVAKSAIADGGLTLAVINDLVPGEIHLFGRASVDSTFDKESVKFTVNDPVFIAVNDKSVFVAVTSTFPMKIHRQDYNRDGNGNLFLAPTVVVLPTDISSSPISFQVDPFTKSLLIGEDLSNGSVLYVFNDSASEILQTLAYTQISFGSNLQISNISKGTMVVQTINTLDEKLGSLLYVYSRAGNLWRQLQISNIENTEQSPLLNVLVGDKILLQSNIQSQNASLVNWKTFVRPDANTQFDFTKAPVSEFTEPIGDISITNFGCNLQVLGESGVVCQGFDADNKKVVTYTTSFSTGLKKWYDPNEIDSVDNSTGSLSVPYQANGQGHTGSVGQNMVTKEDSFIPYTPQVILPDASASELSIYYFQCSKTIPDSNL